VAGPAIANDLEQRLAAAVTDMETASVAEVAHQLGVPFIAVRAVSDVVRSGRSSTSLRKFRLFAAANAAVAAVDLLRAMPPN
jgi:adenosylhomocysteine nucleosidase